MSGTDKMQVISMKGVTNNYVSKKRVFSPFDDEADTRLAVLTNLDVRPYEEVGARHGCPKPAFFP